MLKSSVPFLVLMMESDNKPVLSQKEYLKRYLSKDKHKKKKRKPTISSSSHIKRSVIIDDDLGLKDVADIDDEQFNLDNLGDEAPQIVGIVDERPTEIRAKEKYDSNLWRTVGETNKDGDCLQDSIKHSELTRIKANLDSDSDLSLPRSEINKVEMARKSVDNEKIGDGNSNSLIKKKDWNKYNYDSDLSPERNLDRKKRDRKKNSSESDLSPERNRDNQRKERKKHSSDSGLSPARNNGKNKKDRKKYNYDSDFSPERNNDRNKKDRKKYNDSPALQDAKHLKSEWKKLKTNEDKVFRKMDPSELGAMAAPIQRDRKTGMIKQIEKEKEEERIKAEKRAQTENKYYKWGKGLKQIEEQEDRIADAIHEMSKPLARYRDDKDLDAYLRAQEREGDPMLDYIRNKQAESHNVIDLTVGSSKPMYNGSYMPNRFGIRPGYRWDGVDRSNGYEKRWFEQKNARKAVEEAAYKWSTSDM